MGFADASDYLREACGLSVSVVNRGELVSGPRRAACELELRNTHTGCTVAPCDDFLSPYVPRVLQLSWVASSVSDLVLPRFLPIFSTACFPFSASAHALRGRADGWWSREGRAKQLYHPKYMHF
eukprot:1836828-Prymnesium_polylepis.2